MKIHARTTEIKTIRIKKGYSLRGLADKTKLSNGFLSQIENNQRNPSPETANIICNALEVDFDDIFFIDDAHKCEHTAI